MYDAVLSITPASYQPTHAVSYLKAANISRNGDYFAGNFQSRNI